MSSVPEMSEVERKRERRNVQPAQMSEVEEKGDAGIFSVPEIE
jgi:hypothetical protein